LLSSLRPYPSTPQRHSHAIFHRPWCKFLHNQNEMPHFFCRLLLNILSTDEKKNEIKNAQKCTCITWKVCARKNLVLKAASKLINKN
jgi:hypothetical protein